VRLLVRGVVLISGGVVLISVGSAETLVTSSGRFMPAANAPFRREQAVVAQPGMPASSAGDRTVTSVALETRSSCTKLALEEALATRRPFPPAGGAVYTSPCTACRALP